MFWPSVSGPIDKKTYDALVAAYRADPGNVRGAARAAGCSRGVAKRAWDEGWEGLPAIREVLAGGGGGPGAGRGPALALAAAVLVLAGVGYWLTRTPSLPSTGAEPPAAPTAPTAGPPGSGAPAGTSPSPSVARAPAPEAPRPPLVLPPTYPTDRDMSTYVGPEACKECHADNYEQWRRSPHGKAMALPSKESILGRFDGKTVKVDDGTVRPFVKDGEWWMEIRGPSNHELHRVDLVLASGRQHQSYYTRKPDGSLKLLPVYWGTIKDIWIPTSVAREASLDPSKPTYWQRVYDELDLGCMACHLSQVQYTVADQKVDIRWGSLPVNCESCHGPGKPHIELKRAGSDDDTYRDLKAVDKTFEVEVCGTCHAWKGRFRVPTEHGNRPDLMYLTLAQSEFRSNGTQYVTGYQNAGHLLSPCYLEGAMNCSACHDPHTGDARSLADESAEGEHANKQCTVCHRDLIEKEPAVAHSRHPYEVSCDKCHMPLHWIRDSTRNWQRVSDHSVSIPRPRETIATKNPNACNECHEDKEPEWAVAALTAWGATRALEVRDFVQVFHEARESKDGNDGPALLALVRRYKDHELLLASALELLSHQRADSKMVPALVHHTRNASPLVRGWAVRALITHDDVAKERWRDLGSGDPHPITRIITFQGLRHESAFTDAIVDRHVEDVVRHAERPPVAELRYLIMIQMRRQKWKSALELIGMAEHYASRDQAKEIGLAKARATVESQLR